MRKLLFPLLAVAVVAVGCLVPGPAANTTPPVDEHEAKKKLREIDEWLRTPDYGGYWSGDLERDSEPYSWLADIGFSWCDEADLVYIFDKEIASHDSPGVTYGLAALSKMYEERLVHAALQQAFTDYLYLGKPLFEYMLDCAWTLGVSIAAGGVTEVWQLVGAGFSTLSMGSSALDVMGRLNEIDRRAYHSYMGEYFRERRTFPYGETEECKELAWNLTEDGVWCAFASTATQEDRNRIMQEQKDFFEHLYEVYEGHILGLGPHAGLTQDFRVQNREEMKELFRHGLEKYEQDLPDYPTSEADTTPPDTQVTSGPSGAVTEDLVSFSWSGSDDLSPTSELVYSWYLEGYDSEWSDWTTSTSKQYTGLPNRDYTFNVRAKDQGGNVDLTPAQRAFAVSTEPAAAQMYTLSMTVSPLDGGSVSPSSGQYTSGTQLALTAAPADGFTFDHWSGGASGSSPVTTVTMDSNNSVTAYFEEIPPTPLAESPWPMYGHDPQLSGQSPYVGAQTGMVNWTYSFGGSPYTASPLVGADGTVYIPHSGTGQSRTLTAICPDGTVKWIFEPPDLEDSSNLASKLERAPEKSVCSAAIGPDGMIYVGVTREKGVGLSAAELYAIDMHGSIEWTHTVGELPNVTPAIDYVIIGDDGTIYVVSTTRRSEHSLSAIRPDGTLKWKVPYAGGRAHTPSIGPDGTVYISRIISGRAPGRGVLVAIGANGELKWEYESHHPAKHSAIGQDGTIYIGDQNYGICAINPDGTLRWKTELISQFGKPAVGTDGNIVVPSLFSRTGLVALDSNGVIRWKLETITTMYNGAPSIGADGTIYIGSRNTFYGIASNGTIKWQFETDGKVATSAAIGLDGTVYVATDNGILYAFGSTPVKQ